MELPSATEVVEVGGGGEHRGEGERIGPSAARSHEGEEGEGSVGLARVGVGRDHRVPGDGVPLGHFVEQFARRCDPPGPSKRDELGGGGYEVQVSHRLNFGFMDSASDQNPNDLLSWSGLGLGIVWLCFRLPF